MTWAVLEKSDLYGLMLQFFRSLLTFVWWLGWEASARCGNTPTSPSLLYMEPSICLEVKCGWQRPGFQASGSEETCRAAGSRQHSPAVQCPVSALHARAVSKPFAAGWNTWMNFPCVLSPQEFILVSSETLWSPVWGHRGFQGVVLVNLIYPWYAVA